MLQTVKAVDVKVVGDEEERELDGHRPGAHEVEARDLRMAVHEADESRDEEPEKIALDEAVAHEIREEARAEELLMRVVRPDALEHHERERNADDDCR